MSSTDAVDIEPLRRQYIVERSAYERLGRYVAATLREALRRANIASDVKGRAKEIDSYVKKAMKKSRDPATFHIGDRAGVRVIHTYSGDRETIKGIIEHLFVKQDETDKTSALGGDLLGYRGFHYEVTVDPDRISPALDGMDGVADMRCEVQIQTRAENLWNDNSHPLFYKSKVGNEDPPTAIARRFNRLAALMELFDQELMEVKHELERQPGSATNALLMTLQAHYYRLTSRQYDPELSKEIIGWMLDQPRFNDVEELTDRVDAFVADRSIDLQHIFEIELGSSNPAVLLYQPESILLMEELVHDRWSLAADWEDVYPTTMLEELASRIVVSLDV